MQETDVELFLLIIKFRLQNGKYVTSHIFCLAPWRSVIVALLFKGLSSKETDLDLDHVCTLPLYDPLETEGENGLTNFISQ
jgi:hypothetical protein